MLQPTDPIEKLIIIGSGPAGWTAAIYAARAKLIADALAKAFPAGGPPSAGCIVH